MPPSLRRRYAKVLRRMSVIRRNQKNIEELIAMLHASVQDMIADAKRVNESAKRETASAERARSLIANIENLIDRTATTTTTTTTSLATLPTQTQ